MSRGFGLKTGKEVREDFTWIALGRRRKDGAFGFIRDGENRSRGFLRGFKGGDGWADSCVGDHVGVTVHSSLDTENCPLHVRFVPRLLGVRRRRDRELSFRQRNFGFTEIDVDGREKVLFAQNIVGDVVSVCVKEDSPYHLTVITFGVAVGGADPEGAHHRATLAGERVGPSPCHRVALELLRFVGKTDGFLHIAPREGTLAAHSTCGISVASRGAAEIATRFRTATDDRRGILLRRRRQGRGRNTTGSRRRKERLRGALRLPFSGSGGRARNYVSKRSQRGSNPHRNKALVGSSFTGNKHTQQNRGRLAKRSKVSDERTTKGRPRERSKLYGEGQGTEAEKSPTPRA